TCRTPSGKKLSDALGSVRQGPHPHCRGPCRLDSTKNAEERAVKMRASYHEELESILDQLHVMSHLVEIAMVEATQSLLTADLERAEKVIDEDAKLDTMHEELEYK